MVRSIKTLLAELGEVVGPVPGLRGGGGAGAGSLAKHQDFVEAACAGAAKGRASRQRDCHFAGNPASSLLKRLLKGEGVQQNDSLADG